MTRHKLTIEVLTPIHIGTDQTLEPFDYVVRNGEFYRVSLERWVAGLSSDRRVRFDELLDQNNITRLRQFIADDVDVGVASYTAGVTSGVEAAYKAKLNDVHNQLLIKPFIRSGLTYDPILPGSSIKGAVRTAIVSHAANEAGLPRPQGSRDVNSFESLSLGNSTPGNDPLRALKFPDVALPSSAAVISEVLNARRNRRGLFETASIQMFAETTWSVPGEEPVVVEGELAIDDGLQAYSGSVTMRLTVSDVVSNCNTFYRDKLRRDHTFYSKTPISAVSSQLMDVRTDDSSFLLRVGRYSGKLSVTLDNFREPPDPRTRNVCDGKYPMGWLKVTIVD